MTDLTETARARLRRWLGIALLLALAACGPGTGGTGTGPVGGLVSFGSGGGATAPAAQCAGPCPVVQLRLEPAQVALRIDCVRFVHAGDWSVDAAGVATVGGSIEGGSAPGPGSLRLQFDGAPEQSQRVTATLFDAGGGVVAGPLLLVRQDEPAAPAPACP